jgi:pyruvate dehydrogenase E2 component (dihydrolipoamide acetyltransferase)
MPHEITMPRLSDTMESGTVIKWNVKEGDSVEPGDVLADIETDKATMELQAFEEGTVAKIILQEGESVPVGETILVLAEEGEDVEQAASGAGAKTEQKKPEAEPAKKEEKEQEQQETKARRQDEQESSQKQQPRKAAAAEGEAAESSMRGAYGGVSQTAAQAPASSEPPASEDPAERNGHRAQRSAGRIFASPLARKLAEEHGVDLSTLEGSGPSGRIVKADVEAASRGEAKTGAPQPAEKREQPAPGAPAPAPLLPDGAGLEARTVSLSNMRRTIAKRLVESKTTIPHYQVTLAVDMDRLLELREQLNEQLAAQNVKLTVNDFIVRACAIAMHQHPFVNSKWVESEGEASIEILGEVNVGVAIALPEERGGGLVVATLRNADRMGLRQISAETKRLAKKAREKGLTIEEMADATFTVSNLGMFGVEHFTAIINPPNTAILAVGAAIEQPVARDGRIEMGARMQMTMSSDHRVVDGAMAAQYLNTVRQLLENPATLLV